eukprot:g23637.t1
MCAAAETIVFPLASANSSYDFTVDWRDGNASSCTSSKKNCHLSTAHICTPRRPVHTRSPFRGLSMASVSNTQVHQIPWRPSSWTCCAGEVPALAMAAGIVSFA